ncbi:MAG: DNA mismatch repair endonuclease MutL, partial [Phycisphaerae bacterium]|nr:DNA mismatch repair endonuclease MutL [Phycisphaerae bacterium]
MANINILPTHLVNRIAAGEVIERPASVVKELVENAIDAGATRIDVTVEDGGRKLITVSDNGCGMDGDDAAKAFLPHATSKIAGDEDLSRIDTLGFRGEALASISSISRVRLRTRRPDDQAGWEVAASGDTAGEARPAAGAAGTTISVGELFFNTPARRKFMRTANTEMGHVSEQATRLALPHPQIAFTLTNNGRRTLNLPAVDSTRARINDLFGAELAAGLLPIAAARESVTIEGLIAPPAAARGSSKWQYVLLNGRYIRDRLLGHAIREAYRGLVDPNRWPVVFAFIHVEPDCVDVNVHPTKIEVRFR